MTEMTSEVFLERSSQKKPKTCLAQASGVPAWRHLVAVWQANGRFAKSQDDAHDLGIKVSAAMSLWHLRNMCILALPAACTSEYSSFFVHILTFFRLN